MRALILRRPALAAVIGSHARKWHASHYRRANWAQGLLAVTLVHDGALTAAQKHFLSEAMYALPSNEWPQVCRYVTWGPYVRGG